MLNKIESTKQKQLQQKDQPALRSVKNPSKADMSNWNNLTMAIDKTNKKFYVKVEGTIIAFTGVII